MGKLDVDIHISIDVKHRRKKLRWTLGPVSEQSLTTGPEIRTMLTLRDTQKCVVAVAPVDAKGMPAEVQGTVFSSSDENVVKVVQDTADPNKAVLLAGAPGTAQVSVTADADLGDGVSPLTGTLDVTVIGGQAVSLALTTGTPEEQ